MTRTSGISCAARGGSPSSAYFPSACCRNFPGTAWPGGHDHRAFHPTARRRSRMVAALPPACKMLVFLIDNNEPGAPPAQNRRACADDDTGAPQRILYPHHAARRRTSGHAAPQRAFTAGREKRPLNRSTVCGVRGISSTSTMAPFPYRAVGDSLQIDFDLAAALPVKQEGARVAFVLPGGTRVPRVVFGVPPNTLRVCLRPRCPKERIIFRRAHQSEDSRVIPYIIPLLAQIGFGTDHTIG
jgi:hypothetical protein